MAENSNAAAHSDAYLEQYVRPEDLSGDLQIVARSLGIKAAASMAVNCAGLNLYISGRSLNAARVRWAQEQLKAGMSRKDIASRLGVTERWLSANLPNETAQLGLWEDLTDDEMEEKQ